MKDRAGILATVEHARQVATILQWLGWSVAALGTAGVAVLSVMWAAGQLSQDQAVSLILGTALATVLSGATVYGSGVNVGLGAERLELAATAAAASRPGQPSTRAPGRRAPGR
jgi:hypothetical protein